MKRSVQESRKVKMYTELNFFAADDKHLCLLSFFVEVIIRKQGVALNAQITAVLKPEAFLSILLHHMYHRRTDRSLGNLYNHHLGLLVVLWGSLQKIDLLHLGVMRLEKRNSSLLSQERTSQRLLALELSQKEFVG